MGLPLACGHVSHPHKQTHTNTQSSKRETLAARGVWRHTQMYTHTAGNIDFLFGITKQWVTQQRGLSWSLDHSAHKQTCYAFFAPFCLSPVHTFMTFYKHSQQTPAKNSSSWFHHISYFSTPALPHYLTAASPSSLHIYLCTCFHLKKWVFPWIRKPALAVWLVWHIVELSKR